MKLIQIKEFNTETVTQEIAAEIGAILCWNHLNEDEYRKQVIIENAGPIGRAKDGNGSIHPWDEARKELYFKEEDGVEIQNPCSTRIRIFKNGHAIGAYTANKYSEYDYLSRNRKTGKERLVDREVGHGNQLRLVQLYIDFGFFKVQ